jgi:hypothetical protein
VDWRPSGLIEKLVRTDATPESKDKPAENRGDWTNDLWRIPLATIVE